MHTQTSRSSHPLPWRSRESCRYQGFFMISPDFLLLHSIGSGNTKFVKQTKYLSLQCSLPARLSLHHEKIPLAFWLSHVVGQWWNVTISWFKHTGWNDDNAKDPGSRDATHTITRYMRSFWPGQPKPAPRNWHHIWHENFRFFVGEYQPEYLFLAIKCLFPDWELAPILVQI